MARAVRVTASPRRNVAGAVDDLDEGPLFAKDQPFGLRHREVAARVGMGRWGKVEEIAYPCVFLASDASSWMTGETIVIDGGPSPREMDEG